MNTFSVGNVLATGFRVWLRNLGPFLLIAALFHALPWLWALSATHGMTNPEDLKHATFAISGASILSLLVNVLVSAALTYGVVMELQGQRASFGACIATGLARFFPALGVGLLTSLCMMGGFILLVIPGVIVFCMLYVSTQVSVLERPGIGASLRRSRELTRGHRLQIFGLVLVLAIIGMLLNWILSGVLINRATTPDEVFATLSRSVYTTFVAQVVTGSLSAVMAGVAYYYLRAEKEGTSAAELAAIFD